MTRWMLDLRYPSTRSAYFHSIIGTLTRHELKRVRNIHSERLHLRLDIFPITTFGQHLQCRDRLTEKEGQAPHIRVSILSV